MDHSLHALEAALVALGLLLAGCSEVNERRRFVAEQAPVELLETHPMPGGTLESGAPIRLCMSDLVDPRSVSDTEALVGSGPVVVDVRTDVQLFDWSTSSSSGAACDGSVIRVTPQEPLSPGVTWRLQWTPSLRGWSGAHLDTRGSGETQGWIDLEGGRSFILEFTASGMATDAPLPAPSLRDLFAPGAVFDPASGHCSCHVSPDEDARARALLDLSSPERAYDALVLPARIRDTGFPMVTPGRPSESFLLHKLLRDDEGHALRGIHGHPMPPDTMLPEAALAAVAHWIAAGSRL